jgi:hypothetical protein
MQLVIFYLKSGDNVFGVCHWFELQRVSKKLFWILSLIPWLCKVYHLAVSKKIFFFSFQKKKNSSGSVQRKGLSIINFAKTFQLNFVLKLVLSLFGLLMFLSVYFWIFSQNLWKFVIFKVENIWAFKKITGKISKYLFNKTYNQYKGSVYNCTFLWHLAISFFYC